MIRSMPLQTITGSSWTTLRTLSAAVADSSGLPTAGTLTDLPTVSGNGGLPRLVELYIDNAGATPTLGGSPTSLIVRIYREVDSKVSLIYTWVVSATDATNSDVTPIIIETYGNKLYPKVSFSGGASPTVTATVRARCLE